MYFYQIKCCFYTQNGCMNKTVNSITNTWSIQQTPMFHGCTITNKQNVEPRKLSTSWGHTKVLFTCCLHLNYWNCFANPLFCYVNNINAIFNIHEIGRDTYFDVIEEWRQRYGNRHLEIRKTKRKEANLFNTAGCCI
jgi:hypothetical protein